MITSEIRLKVIDIWLEIFSGGTSKPLIVIEQITYLLFIKKLNEINIRRGRRWKRVGHQTACLALVYNLVNLGLAFFLSVSWMAKSLNLLIDLNC